MSGGDSKSLKGTASVRRAVTIGLLWVNGPVALLIFGPCLWTLAAPDKSQLQRIGLYAIGVGWLLAWLWWSFSVPKWRLWAYERVVNIAELKERAVIAGLTWPDGTLFTRTEIKSRAHAQRERELEQEQEESG